MARRPSAHGEYSRYTMAASLDALSSPTVSGTVFLLISLFLVTVLRRKSSGLLPLLHVRHRLPPGSPGLPLLGNLFDLPQGSPWVGYRELSRRYGASSRLVPGLEIIVADARASGNLVHLQILGRSILLINDVGVASDLLEKRSTNNSSRPVSTAVEM